MRRAATLPRNPENSMFIIVLFLYYSGATIEFSRFRAAARTDASYPYQQFHRYDAVRIQSMGDEYHRESSPEWRTVFARAFQALESSSYWDVARQGGRILVAETFVRPPDEKTLREIASLWLKSIETVTVHGVMQNVLEKADSTVAPASRRCMPHRRDAGANDPAWSAQILTCAADRVHASRDTRREALDRWPVLRDIIESAQSGEAIGRAMSVDAEALATALSNVVAAE